VLRNKKDKLGAFFPKGIRAHVFLFHACLMFASQFVFYILNSPVFVEKSQDVHVTFSVNLHRIKLQFVNKFFVELSQHYRIAFSEDSVVRSSLYHQLVELCDLILDGYRAQVSIFKNLFRTKFYLKIM
jgi:hypothetical protein